MIQNYNSLEKSKKEMFDNKTNEFLLKSNINDILTQYFHTIQHSLCHFPKKLYSQTTVDQINTLQFHFRASRTPTFLIGKALIINYCKLLFKVTLQKIIIKTKKRMGNDPISTKLQNNNEEQSPASSIRQQKGFDQQDRIYEYEQRQNQTYVFQKKIYKKTTNRMKNKLAEAQSHIGQAQKSSGFKQDLKLKPSFTQTLFDKEKMKKVQYKVVQDQSVLGCDLIRCQEEKQNINPSPSQNKSPNFKPMMISQEAIFKIKKMKINEKYRLQEIIGQGGFGIVYRAQCLLTHQERAVKVLQLKKCSQFQKDLILNEVTLISRLDHPNIIKIYEIFEYDSTYFIVTQYCEGGSLGQYLKTYKPSNKQDFAKKIIYKLLSALKYMHSKNIIHRDIKLQNIVFKRVLINGREEMIIKLIDFGLATEFHDKKPVKSERVIGTPQYLPPESIKGMYYPKSDIWCCGIILHFLLLGSYPFKGVTRTEIMTKVKNKRVSFRCTEWSGFSNNAKDLLNKMLSKSLEDRLNADKALSHVWFNDYLKQQQSLLSKVCEKASQIASQLLNFQRCDNLTTYLDSYTILTKLCEYQRQKLIVYFNLIDENRNGVIQLNELRDYFSKYNIQLSEQELDNLFRKLDLNNSQSIYLNQFIYAITNVQKYYEKSHIAQLFDLIDTNNDGFIDRHQLKCLLNQCNHQEIDFFMKTIGKRSKGKINLDDFNNYIQITERRKRKIFL